jgi:N-acetylglucosaminyldiphosphoundecaprenol N-acetyl-beta-D-mannosaminyltransferase
VDNPESRTAPRAGSRITIPPCASPASAIGTPRQDKWIAAHKDQFGAKVAIGVGGLFDFYSGRIPRAPVWMRELGMEWFYRFYQEPRRMWRRYFVGNAVFLYRVACERLRARSSPRTGGVAS